MKKTFLSILTIFYLFLPHTACCANILNPDSLKTKIGISIKRNYWDMGANGLIQWADSRYYQTDIDTEFDFSPTFIYCPSIKLDYKKISFCYEYASNGLPGLIYLSEYQADFKRMDGTLIHPIQTSLNKQKFRISYDLNRKNLNVFIEAFIMKKDIAGLFEGPIDIPDPLSNLWIKSKNSVIGVGFNIQQKLKLKNFFVFGEAFLAPFSKLSFTYQHSIFDDLLNRKLKGWGGHLHLGVGYHWNDLSLKIGYQPELYQTNNNLVKNEYHSLTMGVLYTF
jgi:hypothetical protein